MLLDRCNIKDFFPLQVILLADFTSKMCYVISLLFVIYFEIDAIRIKR
jgi:hypothetical protein